MSSCRTIYVVTLLVLYLLDLLNTVVISHLQGDSVSTQSYIEMVLFESLNADRS